MAKERISTTLMVADGNAGLVRVDDLRFDAAEWPITFDVAANLAEEWFKQFHHACHEHGWNWSGMAQHDLEENSGTLYIRHKEGGKPPIATIVWERTRSGPLLVKLRPCAEWDSDDVNGLLSLVSRRVIDLYREMYHRVGYLEYYGKPWRGELWLGDTLRLGPPTRFPAAINGPQAIVVDSNVSAIGATEAPSEFEREKREVSIFLSVVLR